MLLRILLGLIIAYAVLVLLAWAFQERMAFPAPPGALPDVGELKRLGAERIELVMRDGTRIAGVYLPPRPATPPGGQAVGRSGGQKHAGLLWFYGNGENIGAIWDIVVEWQPPGVGVLVVDYPGYGASGGRTTEPGLYEAADLAYQTLAGRADVDPARIFVYGRSLGSTVATHTAAGHQVAGLVLESPFTNAREMSGQHYGLFPRFILRLRLDNLGTFARVRCPVLVFHGTADRLVPPRMGEAVARAAPGPVELVWIEGAGHNTTYEVGGKQYRQKLWDFVAAVRSR
ncbi:MAG TPA: alpha/beta hydrolase [Gemmatimonadales bacterium]